MSDYASQKYDEILKRLNSLSPAERARVINALAGDKVSSPNLIRALEHLAATDGDSDVQEAALQTLASRAHAAVRRGFSLLPTSKRKVILAEIDRWWEQGLITSNFAELLRGRYSRKPQIKPEIQPEKIKKPSGLDPIKDPLSRKKPPISEPVQVPSIEEPKVKQIVAGAGQSKAGSTASRAAIRIKKPTFSTPTINWASMWENTLAFVTSGALLRTLLYLGAFMIVVAAAVLVVRFWNIFPEIIQLTLIAAIPAAFFLAGWGVRVKLELPQAGHVLSGIGALMVAIDFAAVYQFGGIEGRVDLESYWFLASLICTGIYAVSAWRLPTEFFGYILILGASSTVLAITGLVGLPLEWQIASVSILAVGIIEGSRRIKIAARRWENLALAGWRASHILIFASSALVLFVSGDSELGQAATLLAASVGFGLLFRGQANAIYAHAMVWSAVGVFVFLMRLIGLPIEWYGIAIGIYVIINYLAGLWLSDEISENSPRRNVLKLAFESSHWALIGLSGVTGAYALFIDLDPGIVALTLTSIHIGWSAYRFQRPRMMLASGVIFLIPFTLTLNQWLTIFEAPQLVAWMMTGWSGLAMLYIGLGISLPEREKFGTWFTLIAHSLAPSALFGLLLNSVLGSADWYALPTLVALGTIILLYAVSAFMHDQGKYPGLSNSVTLLSKGFGQTLFLWPPVILIPIWIAIAWNSGDLNSDWLGAVFGGLSLAYVGVGELLSQREVQYRRPFQLFAYLIAGLSILVSLGDTVARMTTLYLVVAVFGSLAFLTNSFRDGAIAALLLIWPFRISLQLSPLTQHAYPLAFALLASLGYIPLGNFLSAAKQKATKPVYFVGYGLAFAAVVTSSLGRVNLFPIEVPWIAVLTPLIVTALMVYSAQQYKHRFFAWAGGLGLAISFGQALDLFNVPSAFLALAWVALAFGYLLINRMIARRKRAKSEEWLHLFDPVQVAGAVVIAVLGLSLTTAGTIAIFAGERVNGHLPLILAQTLAVGLAVYAAWAFRKRLPVYIAALLSFFPYTLAVVGFGPDFTIAQYSWAWMVLTILLLGTGFWLDKSTHKYGHGPYFVGYLLSVFALAWSTLDRLTNIYALGFFLILAVTSQRLVHARRHKSFEDFIRFVYRRPGTLAREIARTSFTYIAAIGLPVLLVQVLVHLDVLLAWRGLALALLAPAYIALGLVLKRVRAEYATPLFGVGYMLTAIGAMVAFNDEPIAIIVLALNAVVYAASATIFKQPFWLYLSTVLLPVIAVLTLHFFQLLVAPWVSGIFMALTFGYIAVGTILDRRVKRQDIAIEPFAMPFFGPGYLISAVALAVASSEKFLAIGIFSAAAVLYAFSAWSFRETLFLYPAVWLLAVPYYLTMTLTALPSDWYGLGWIPLIIGLLVVGRIYFQKSPLNIRNLRSLLESLTHSAMPFYSLAYLLSLSMLAISTENSLVLFLAFTAGSLIYFSSAALFKHVGWTYAGLFTTHFALIPLFRLLPFDLPIQYLSLLYLPLTLVMVAIGNSFARQQREEALGESKRSIVEIWKWKLDLGNWRFLDYLSRPTWGRPFFLFALADIIIWQAFAANNVEVAILFALGSAVLLASLGMIWRDSGFVYGSLLLFLIGIGSRFSQAGLPLEEQMAWLGGLGLAMYFGATLIEYLIGQREKRWVGLKVWPAPLTQASVILTGIALIITFPKIEDYGLPATAALGFAGLLYLAIATREGYLRLGYFGLALLELDWALILIDQEISQPQLYAIPVGLYFTLIGYLERRQGRKLFGNIVEGFGLLVLMLTAFIQSIDELKGFGYFGLLLVEGLLVIFWGVSQQRNIPLFLGIGASVLNVIAQVVVLISVYDVNRWIVILGTGLLLVSAAVYVERKREQIVDQAEKLRDVLDSWE